MTISVSSEVNVSISIGASFPARAGFGTLNIVTEERVENFDLTNRVFSYQNLNDVAAEWPEDSEVLAAATAYFNQQPKPTLLKVSNFFVNGHAAELRGGDVPDTEDNLANFTIIPNGSFQITLNTVTENITNLDFTSATSFNEIAKIIEDGFHAVIDPSFLLVKCVYDGTRFFITNANVSSSSYISFLTRISPLVGTDISSMLQMREDEATKINGIDPETITTALNAIQNIDSEWYGLVFTKLIRDDIIINGEYAVQAAANWCESNMKVFGNTSNDLDVLDSVTDTDIASVLKAKNLRRTMTTFSSYRDEYPSASILGRAFTVDFSQPNSTITLKFKQMPGITVEQLGESQKNVLDSKNANALVKVGTSDMFAESFMASGVFFDEVHGIDWLKNAIETNVFGYLLTRSTKVSYTNKGVAAIEQQVINALDEAVRNGLIGSGETVDGRFLATGYETTVIPVEDINQSDKEARHYPGLSFTALGAGAIHSIQINGIFER